MTPAPLPIERMTIEDGEDRVTLLVIRLSPPAPPGSVRRIEFPGWPYPRRIDLCRP